jgi:TM2 domain-containing membrane protein YozV
MEFQGVSPKSRLAALLLCAFVGVFGAHRFYVGKIGTGVLMLVTLGGLGIWSLVDLILISVGSFRDKDGLRLYRWTEPGAAGPGNP